MLYISTFSPFRFCRWRPAGCQCGAVSLQPTGRSSTLSSVLQRPEEVYRIRFRLPQSWTVPGLLPAVCTHVSWAGVQQSWKWGKGILSKVSAIFNFGSSLITGLCFSLLTLCSLSLGSVETRSATMKMTCVFCPAWQKKSTWEATRPCWTSVPASLCCAFPEILTNCWRGTCRSDRTTRSGTSFRSTCTSTSLMECHGARVKSTPCLAAWLEKPSARPTRLRLAKYATACTHLA